MEVTFKVEVDDLLEALKNMDVESMDRTELAELVKKNIKINHIKSIPEYHDTLTGEVR